MAINRILRQERKFLLNSEEYIVYKNKFSRIFGEDKHNGINGYTVRSLYFDTIWDRDLWNKLDGIETRRKLRLRIYDPDTPFVLFEMKQKQGSNQLKRSLQITREDAAGIIQGQYQLLLKYKEDFAKECYGVLVMNTYRPKIIIEYQRRAFVLKENNIRITFDNQIKATSFCNHFFEKQGPYYPVMHPASAVLEVKYNNFLLSYVKDILDQCNKSEIAISKYALARQRKSIF
jgi:hypothetical protein